MSNDNSTCHRTSGVHAREYVRALLVSFILISSVVPLFINDAVGEDSKKPDVEPYIYIPQTTYGTFGYKVNESFYRNWLNNTVTWNVEKSLDGSKWTDYEKFEVKKVWNKKNLSEKHTVIVNSDEDAYYRISTNTAISANLVSYFDKSVLSIDKNESENKSNDFELSFKITDDCSYTLIYNWDDYLNSDIAGKSSFSKQIKTDSIMAKQSFEWSVVSTVKIKSGDTFILDPTYGIMPAAVTSSYTYDAQEGLYPDAIRLGTSQYCAVVSTGDTGTEYDGYLRILKVWSNNGTIQQGLVDSWEYDSSDGYYSEIEWIYGDIYAIAYNDTVAGVKYITVVTVSIDDATGLITKSIIDTQRFTYGSGNSVIQLMRFNGNVFCILYYISSYTYLETFTINDDGTIDNAILDTQTIDACSDPHMAIVDSDTIVVVHCDVVGSDGYMSTWNVSAAGIITNTRAAFWEFDTSKGAQPSIEKVTGNIFMVAYEDTNNDIFIKTCQINDTGSIWKTWKDTQAIDTTNGNLNYLFNVTTNTITNNWIKGVSFQGENGDGYVSTFNINNLGAIGSELDTLEFDAANCLSWAPVTYMGGNYYIITYQGTTTAGLAKTIYIETNSASPTLSNPSPANGATGISLTPRCNITINDLNGDTMNLCYYENSTGSWIFRQKNSTCANGTYRWTNAQATSNSQKYYWEIFVDDGMYNVSTIYNFTTVAGGVENTAPTMDSFNIDTEPGATAGWDWDNNDAQMDWATTDDDADPVTIYITYNKGSTAREPTIADYDFHIQDDDATDLDCNWETTAGWTDYDGVVYVRIRAYDGTVYSATQINDTLAEGIDGTDPTGTIDAIADNTNPASIEGDSTDATSGVASNDITIFDDTDNLYWDGNSWEVGATWLDCTGTTSWSYDSSGVSWVAGNSILITLQIYDVAGQIDASADTESFTTTELGDTTPPNITINFAGNHSDKGGPYWQPPGEITALSGTNLDGYYTNNSRQHEGWIYVNLTIVDTESSVTNVWLQWLNKTGINFVWTNWTYAFVHGSGNYWAYNTSGHITTHVGSDYSFNIVANSSGGSNTTWWNKTGLGGSYTRRYIQLNCIPVNISYQPFYFFDLTYGNSDANKEDRLKEDQGPDGGYTTGDTGYFKNIALDNTVQDVKCVSYLGFWYANEVCNQPFTLNNIYFHIWQSTKYNGDFKITTCSGRRNIGSSWVTIINNINLSYAQNKSQIYYDNGLPNYNDFCTLLVDKTTNINSQFTDNNIYELQFFFRDKTQDVGYPNIISNSSFQSWVIFNIPSNATLNNTDWTSEGGLTGDADGDGLSDWTELYVNYTNPFVSDSDNDGQTDWNETQTGSDPNNYTSTIPYTPTAIDVDVSPDTWIIGNIYVDTSIQKNFTFWQNGSVTIDITIGINNTNFTFVNYASWLSLGHDRYCANFTVDNWITESSITPGYPPSSVLKNDFAPGNFNFGVRIWMPRTVTYYDTREDFKIVLIVSEST